MKKLVFLLVVLAILFSGYGGGDGCCTSVEFMAYENETLDTRENCLEEKQNDDVNE